MYKNYEVQLILLYYCCIYKICSLSSQFIVGFLPPHDKINPLYLDISQLIYWKHYCCEYKINTIFLKQTQFIFLELALAGVILCRELKHYIKFRDLQSLHSAGLTQMS